MNKTYYTTEDGVCDISTQILPMPFISIKVEPEYSSDNQAVLIGYKNIISLTGTITSYQRDANIDTVSVGGVLDQIAHLRNKLSLMGGFLYIKDDENNNVLIGKGGKLISFNISDSNNNWVSTAPFTAEIEFQDIQILGNTVNCSTPYLNSSSLSNNIVDITKYKLKSFTDGWTINLQENIYDRIKKIDSDQILDIENTVFNISYNIQATGKHYYIDNKLQPAWEQAKNFCQDRLYKQVTGLVRNILQISSDTACSPTKTLNSMGGVSGSGGLLNTLNSDYKIFNETVSCSTSESDGSFSATYNGLVAVSQDFSKHTFTKKINSQKQDSRTTTIDIEGTIQGYIEGGLIYLNSGTFNLPQNGNLIIQGSNSSNKYTNALNTLATIFEGSDFKDTWKDKLGITSSGLNTNQGDGSCPAPSGYPKPVSVNLTRDYHQGTINYSLQFSSMKNCGQQFSNIDISVEKPVSVYATFTIPNAGSGVGTILQDIGTKTPQKINITIQGRDTNQKICCSPLGDKINVNNLCSDIVIPPYISGKLPNEDIYILTNKTQDINMVDGSYTINLGYICPSGCSI